jgi:multiple sugar transport system ATP-binding protein
MAGILVESLTKDFGSVAALKEMSVAVAEGSLVVLLGPSGCGKTTTLRCIAGLETPEGGEVSIGDRLVFSSAQGVNLPPKDRGVGFVFQNYALYPHMDVYRNVAFGLHIRRVPEHEVRRRVREALALVDLEGFESRYPRQLSGGQQQRVAVARMIVSRPGTLLFDEPLSNLDPVLRTSVRLQLKKLHRELGATSLYVTHDQEEAMILGDCIAVMVDGRIEQVGSPQEIYHFPATVRVAGITGEVRTNLLCGEVHAAERGTFLLPEFDPYCFIPLREGFRARAGQRLVFHVRPEDLEILPRPSAEEGQLRVLAVTPRGSDTLVHLRIGEHQEQVIASGPAGDLASVTPGQGVALRFRRGNIYHPDSGRLMGSFGYDERESP